MNTNENNTSLPFTNLEQNIGNEYMAKKKTERLAPRFNITVTSYRKHIHDPDGISVKAVLDGTVRAGLLPDDSTKEVNQITFKSIISKEEKTVIEIKEI